MEIIWKSYQKVHPEETAVLRVENIDEYGNILHIENIQNQGLYYYNIFSNFIILL